MNPTVVHPAVARLADAALEASVVGSFSSVGFRARRALEGWPERVPGALKGRRVVVTGAGSGPGLAAATEFARLGASVYLVVRDPARGAACAETISAATGNAMVQVISADVSDLASVGAASAQLQARAGRLDVLVHNAGRLWRHRSETADGIERTFAAHVVGPHLLTALLRHNLPAGGRVVFVSGGGLSAPGLNLDDLQCRESTYHAAVCYARAKRAQLYLAEGWARLLGPHGVSVHTAHPGWADTPGAAAALAWCYEVARPLLRSPAQAADTIVWLATAAEPATSSGGFWLDRRRRRVDGLAWSRTSPSDKAALWDAVSALAGMEDLVGALVEPAGERAAR